SFLALILLTCKLYDVDREITFLQHVANEWLSPATLNRELLHNTGPPGPVISNSHQPQVQALQASASSAINLYSTFNQSQHFALPLVISTSPTSNAHQLTVRPNIPLTPQSAPLSHPPPISDPNLQNIIFLVESLRDDIDVLIGELSDRTV